MPFKYSPTPAVENYVQKIVDNFKTIEEGNRNNSVSKLAYQLFRVAGGGYITEDEVHEIVHTENDYYVGLPISEIKTILRSARKGMNDPYQLDAHPAQVSSHQLSQRREAQRQKDENNIKKAVARFERMPWCSENCKVPYLSSKGLLCFAHLFKHNYDNLYQPLVTPDGELVGYHSIPKETGHPKIASDGSAGRPVTLTFYECHRTDNKHSTAFVCEGASDALTALLVMNWDSYSANGSKKVLSVCEAIKGRYKHVIAILDRDKAGDEAKALCLAAGFGVFQPPSEEKVKDLNELYLKHRKVEIVKQYITEGISYQPTEAPSTAKGKPFSVELTKHDGLVELQFGMELGKRLNYPLNSAILATVSAHSSLSGLNYCTTYKDGTRLPIGLYTAHEQPTGTGKSAILKALTIESRHQLAAERYQKAQDLLQQPDAEVAPEGEFDLSLYSPEGTPEGIDSKILRFQDGYFSLASAEQTLIDTLFGYTYTDNPKKSNLLMFLNGFGGEFTENVRHGRDSFRGLVHGNITVLGQEGLIDTILHRGVELGVASRFLLLKEPQTDAFYVRRADRDYSHKTVSKLEKMHNQFVENMVQQTLERQSVRFLQDLKVIPLSEEAFYHLDDYFDDNIHPKLKDDQNVPQIERTILSKVDVHVMKLAAHLYVYDCIVHQRKPDAIPLQFVEIAIDMVMQIVRHELTFTVEKQEMDNPEHDYILGLIRRAKHRGKTVEQLRKNMLRKSMFNAYKHKKDRVCTILNILVEQGDIVYLLSEDIYVAVEFAPLTGE